MYSFKQIYLPEDAEVLCYPGAIIKWQQLTAFTHMERLLEDAQQQAEQVVAQAEAEAKQLTQKLQDDVQTELEQQQRSLDESNEALVLDLQEHYRKCQVELDQEIMSRVKLILKKALERLSENIPPSDKILAVISELMTACGSRRGSKLYVSEQDYAYLQEVELDCELVLDAYLQPGECRLSADDGSWSLSFNEWLARLVSAANA